MSCCQRSGIPVPQAVHDYFFPPETENISERFMPGYIATLERLEILMATAKTKLGPGATESQKKRFQNLKDTYLDLRLRCFELYLARKELSKDMPDYVQKYFDTFEHLARMKGKNIAVIIDTVEARKARVKKERQILREITRDIKGYTLIGNLQATKELKDEQGCLSVTKIRSKRKSAMIQKNIKHDAAAEMIAEKFNISKSTVINYYNLSK